MVELLIVNGVLEGLFSIRDLEPRRYIHTRTCHLLSYVLLGEVLVSWHNTIQAICIGITFAKLAVAGEPALCVVQVSLYLRDTGPNTASKLQLTSFVN